MQRDAVERAPQVARYRGFLIDQLRLHAELQQQLDNDAGRDSALAELATLSNIHHHDGEGDAPHDGSFNEQAEQ